MSSAVTISKIFSPHAQHIATCRRSMPSIRARACARRVQKVAQRARQVTVDADAVARFVDALGDDDVARLKRGCRGFDDGAHHGDVRGDDEAMAMFTLCVDAINFCFWPDHDDGVEEGLEYEHLTRGWRNAHAGDWTVLTCERLQTMSGPDLRAILNWPRPLPDEETRARLIREVGDGLAKSFGGSCAEFVRAANGSAVRLVELLLEHFPGFRDEVHANGDDVFFYKRAQIFVGDLWGGFRGQGLGSFHDIEALTMFADYRVPVTLREQGILHYDDALLTKIVNKEEIPANSAEEVEIRACTVMAVEAIRESFAKKHGERVSSIVIDWYLWERGEEKRKTSVEPHHRTRTTFY